MFSIKKYQRGFTLVEILLVMLITSVLVLAVNAAFKQVHMLWSGVKEENSVYQKTRLLFNTLTEELICLYMPQVNDDQPAPFILSKSAEGVIRLSFFTMNPALENAATSSRSAKIIYEFTTDPDSGHNALSRTKQLFSGEKPIGTEQTETILEDFSEISIQAVDSSAASLTDWKMDMQCDQNPPKAVKVLLKWPKDEWAEFEFETIIKITSQGQLTPP